MAKRFGEILTDSWKEYKDNWKVYTKMLLLLSFIPALIVFLIEILLMRDILFNVITSTLSPSLIFTPRFFLFMLLGIITAVLTVWLQASLIYNSIYRKKSMNVKDSLSGGKKYFWKLLGLTLLILIIFFAIAIIVGIIVGIGVLIIIALTITNIVSLLIILILFLLVIAAILYAIYLGIKWTFSVYILIGENKGIIDSLKVSTRLVKGRWWKTLGYLSLFGLIILGIYIIYAIIILIINYAINPNYFSNPLVLDINRYIATQFISLILNFILASIITPFSIVFIKNLYNNWKSSKK